MSGVKRVVLSLVSALISESIVSLALSVKDHSGLNGIYAGAIGFSIFVVPGWLLTLPMVLAFRRTDGWRFWLIGAYGTLLGPLIILTWAIACKVTEHSAISDFIAMGEIAFVIAFLATAFYLSILRYSSRDSIEAAR